MRLAEYFQKVNSVDVTAEDNRALDATLRADHRRGEKVRRVEYPGSGRLKLGARARRSREGR
jgi:hypothetical protein